ncbi:MAG: hypothetical protein ACPLZ9_04225, partial [Candidatus Ratteibacteria bacterium]
MISRVKKFNIFFLGEESTLLRTLQKLGIVEIEHISFEGFEKRTLSKDEIEDKIKKLEFLKNAFIESGEKETSEKIIIDEEEEKEIIKTFPLEDIYKNVFELFQEIERREKIIQRIEKLKEEISPFLNTEIIFSEIFSLSSFSFFVFSLPQKTKLEGVFEDLHIEKIGEFQKDILYIILFRKEKIEIAENFLKQIDGKILSVRNWNKKIKDIFEKLENIKERNGNIILEIKNKISEIKKERKKIFVCYDYYKSIYEFVSAQEKLGVSKFVKGIKGW